MRLAYTGLRGELEHLKIETRLTDESFECVMGECDLEGIGDPSIFNIIRSATALVRMWPTLDLSCEENAARRKWKVDCAKKFDTILDFCGVLLQVKWEKNEKVRKSRKEANNRSAGRFASQRETQKF